MFSLLFQRERKSKSNSLELRHTSFSLRDPLLTILNVEFDLGDGDLDLRDPLLDGSELGLQRPLVSLERDEFLLSLDALLLVLGDDLRLDPVGSELGAHPSLLDSSSSSTHGSRDVDEVSSERDDSPSLLSVGDSVGLFERVGDESVSGGFEEGGGESTVLGLDEVEESRDVFWGFELTEILVGELVENEDVGSTSGSTKMLDDSLSLLDVVRDERVERSSTGGGDSDVVLVVDDSEVSETSVESSESTHLRELLETREHRVLSLAGSEGSLRLVGLLTSGRSLDSELLSLTTKRLRARREEEESVGDLERNRRESKNAGTNSDLLLGRNELLLEILLLLDESLESFDLKTMEKEKGKGKKESVRREAKRQRERATKTNLVLSSSFQLRQSRLSLDDSLPHPGSLLDEKIPFTRSDVDSSLLLADLRRPGFELLLLDLDLVGELGGLVCEGERKTREMRVSDRKKRDRRGRKKGREKTNPSIHLESPRTPVPLQRAWSPVDRDPS